ncbi:hypothetical protein [Pukyongiella litopenaei]|uniref:hypothetical protein n=1 Tax=Pukyongiella litopenaei TaxID=2605946 RepID=UPI001B809AD7|nr:hypothetical protein [Pukyongiella litopenaei]
MTRKLFKFLLYLLCLAFLGVVAYAYIGPLIGSDFDAPTREIRQPVTLHAD